MLNTQRDRETYASIKMCVEGIRGNIQAAISATPSQCNEMLQKHLKVIAEIQKVIDEKLLGKGKQVPNTNASDKTPPKLQPARSNSYRRAARDVDKHSMESKSPAPQSSLRQRGRQASGVRTGNQNWICY